MFNKINSLGFFSYFLYSPTDALPKKSSNPLLSEPIEESRSFSQPLHPNPTASDQVPLSSHPHQNSILINEKIRIVWKGFQMALSLAVPLCILFVLRNFCIVTNRSSSPSSRMIENIIHSVVILLSYFMINPFLSSPDDAFHSQTLNHQSEPSTPPFIPTPSAVSAQKYQRVTCQEDLSLFLFNVEAFLSFYFNRSSDLDSIDAFTEQLNEQMAFFPEMMDLKVLQSQAKELAKNPMFPSSSPASFESSCDCILEKLLFAKLLANIFQKNNTNSTLFDWFQALFKSTSTSTLEATKNQFMLDFLSNNKQFLQGDEISCDLQLPLTSHELFLFPSS
ncbi:MAG: hypothetical protein QRY72_04900 [Candidatus Rhabdochlamydia sp.]